MVDAALRFRPPESTEQILHPDAYLRVEQPRRVSLRGPVAALGAGWRPALRSTFGEWQTQKLLARAGGTGSARAAAGWGGDRYALLERGDERALVMRWTWDSRARRGRVRGGAARLGGGGAAGLDPGRPRRVAHAGRARPRWRSATARSRSCSRRTWRSRGAPRGPTSLRRVRAGSSAVRAAGS